MFSKYPIYNQAEFPHSMSVRVWSTKPVKKMSRLLKYWLIRLRFGDFLITLLDCLCWIVLRIAFREFIGRELLNALAHILLP